MAQEITLPRGDTFIADGTYLDANNAPIDINAGGITIESYIKDRNNLTIPLTVTILPTIGTYRITSATDTWPLGRVSWHIRYTQDSVKKSSEPVIINVESA